MRHSSNRVLWAAIFVRDIVSHASRRSCMRLVSWRDISWWYTCACRDFDARYASPLSPHTIGRFSTHSVVVNMSTTQSDHEVRSLAFSFCAVKTTKKNLSGQSSLHKAYTKKRQTCWGKWAPNLGRKRARWKLATYPISQCLYNRWVVFTSDYTPQARDIVVIQSAGAYHTCWLCANTSLEHC